MIKKFVLLAVAASYLSACTTTDPYTGEQKVSNTAGGAALGALGGALVGVAVGGGGHGKRNAALIGAGIGALAGGAIGNYMDQQEAELRAQLEGTGISVTRNGDNIILNMPSNITFDVDQDAVKPGFYPTLNSVAIVLRKFNRTLIDVNGHTDSTGSLQHNQDLSQRRALSVAITSVVRASTSAASPPSASARPSPSPPTLRRPAARRTAASRSRSRRSRKVEPALFQT